MLAGVGLVITMVALLFSLPSQALALTASSFVISTDSNTYHLGYTVSIQGSGLSAKSEYITVNTYSPDKTLYHSDKVRVNTDGSFVDQVYLDYGSATTGEYKITAKSGKQTAETSFVVVRSFQIHQEGYSSSKKSFEYVYLDLSGDYQIKDGAVVFDSNSLYGSLYIDGTKSGSFNLNKIKITLSHDMKKLSVNAKLTDSFSTGNVTAQMKFEDIDLEEGYGGYSDASKNVLKVQISKYIYDTGNTSYGYIEVYS